MDINGFLGELLREISHLDFVDSIDFHIEVITIKGRVLLKREPYFVEIYYNEVTGTMAFALIENNKRLWGIDYDNVRKWHEHPVENPLTHKSISEKSISDIIKELQKTYLRLQD
jgi:hypothetical protein